MKLHFSEESFFYIFSVTPSVLLCLFDFPDKKINLLSSADLSTDNNRFPLMHLFTLPSVRFLSAFSMHPGRQLQPVFQNIIQLYKNPLSVLCFIILLLSVYREPAPASFVTYFCIQKGHLPKSCQCPYYIFLKSHIYIV